MSLRGCTFLFLVGIAGAAVYGQDRDLAAPPLDFLDDHCFACHSGVEAAGSFDLGPLEFDTGDLAEITAARKIRRRLVAGDMPPKSETRPLRDDLDQATAWAGGFVDHHAPRYVVDPGRVTIRRLSRFEYENTIRDLLGVDARDLSQGFPVDDLSYGFDNIGDALSLSTLHLEKYLEAAESIAERTIVTEDWKNPERRRLQAELMVSSLGSKSQSGDRANLYANGEVSSFVSLPREGDYLLCIRASADQAGPDPARMEVSFGGTALETLSVRAKRRKPQVYELPVRLAGGRHELKAAFINDYYRPDHPDRNQRDRNLHIDWLEVVGPLDAPVIPSGHVWIVERDPHRGSVRSRARAVAKGLIARAWRRPARTEEANRLAKLVTTVVEEGGSFEEGVQQALVAALVSPHFLFRMEPRRAGMKAGEVAELSDHALASRLSYFLWSSLPDERLRNLAQRKRLGDPEVFLAETRRMLADERAEALATGFATQWLELRRLEETTPDPERFPTYSAELEAGLRRETQLFFDAFRREPLDVREMLTADFTFLDERVARHYGRTDVGGQQMRRVALDGERRGLLAHASIHTLTSNPTRTSPVKRGKWILENLLDASPPPPPPGADSFVEEAVTDSAATLREQMELHRSRPDCFSCHSRMDALGLALENFDPIGRWRVSDASGPIDVSGELPDGRRLEGFEQLRSWLAGEDFVRCLAKKLFIYAIGRDATPDDEVALDAMLIEVRAEDAVVTLEDLVVGIVRMDAFRRRRVVE